MKAEVTTEVKKWVSKMRARKRCPKCRRKITGRSVYDGSHKSHGGVWARFDHEEGKQVLGFQIVSDWCGYRMPLNSGEDK